MKIAVHAHSIMTDFRLDFDSLNALLLGPFKFKSVWAIILWSTFYITRLQNRYTSRRTSTNVQLFNDELRPCHTFSNNNVPLRPLILFMSHCQINVVKNYFISFSFHSHSNLLCFLNLNLESHWGNIINFGWFVIGRQCRFSILEII